MNVLKCKVRRVRHKCFVKSLHVFKPIYIVPIFLKHPNKFVSSVDKSNFSTTNINHSEHSRTDTVPVSVSLAILCLLCLIWWFTKLSRLASTRYLEVHVGTYPTRLGNYWSKHRCIYFTDIITCLFIFSFSIVISI